MTKELSFDQQSIITVQEMQMTMRRLEGRTHHTPVQTSKSFDELAGSTTLFKCEQFQRTGAFKFRGAFNKLSTLSNEQSKRGVVAYSSGNHGQAVALSARLLHMPAIICMPDDAPRVKLAAVRAYGAEVIFYNRHTQNREQVAQDIARQYQMALIPPSDDAMIIAGHATVAWEFLQDAPELTCIAVPVGGGGLLAGACLSAGFLAPNVKIVGVQTEAANHAYLSLQKQERVTIAPAESVADGLRTCSLGLLPWSIVQRRVDEILLVSEADVRNAVRFLHQRLKLVVEPTGAVAAAAALRGQLRDYGRYVGVILSGGNIDPALLSTILTETS